MKSPIIAIAATGLNLACAMPAAGIAAQSKQGKPLVSAEKCYWKVQVWDEHSQTSRWSDPATFEMGLLNKKDWQGESVATDKDISVPLFRKEFHILGDIKRAINPAEKWILGVPLPRR